MYLKIQRGIDEKATASDFSGSGVTQRINTSQTKEVF